jgi:hypothetical protein
MDYDITYDEKMLIRRRVKVTADNEDEAVDQILAGMPFSTRVVLKVESGSYTDFKVEEHHAD